MMNEQLISELPELLDLRIPYFDPSFEAMIRMQCKFAEEGYEKLGGVQRSASFCSLVAASLTSRTASSLLFSSRYFDDSVRDDYAAGQLDAQVRTVSHRLVLAPSLMLMWPGREYTPGNAGAHHLRRQLNGSSHQCSIHDITLSY